MGPMAAEASRRRSGPPRAAGASFKRPTYDVGWTTGDAVRRPAPASRHPRERDTTPWCETHTRAAPAANGIGDSRFFAKIGFADSLDVVFGPFEVSLCGILSGDVGSTVHTPADDCLTDPETWRHPPDSTIGSELAWQFEATFAASPVRIEDD
ncbi:MAG: hypothetical protein QME96_16740 [Myxococcota bacterium]|nr:hypothetical protein [Myxococcota bacterium]